MTGTEFKRNIELKKEMDFEYKGTKYSVSYGKDEHGRNFIAFGEYHQLPEYYYSYGELMNNAKIRNSWLKYTIDSLDFLI